MCVHIQKFEIRVFLSINSHCYFVFCLRKGITLPQRRESPSTGIRASLIGSYVLRCNKILAKGSKKLNVFVPKFVPKTFDFLDPFCLYLVTEE